MLALRPFLLRHRARPRPSPSTSPLMLRQASEMRDFAPRPAVALVPARPALQSPIAESLRERGYFLCDGVVTGLQMPRGQNTATVSVASDALSGPTQTTGGDAVVLTLDIEAARYLPPNTEVEVALRIKASRSLAEQGR